jgi:hypothetical protein
MGFGLVIGFIEHFKIITTTTTALSLIHALCSSLQHVLRLLSLFSLTVSLQRILTMSSAYVLTGWQISQLIKLTAKLLWPLSAQWFLVLRHILLLEGSGSLQSTLNNWLNLNLSCLWTPFMHPVGNTTPNCCISIFFFFYYWWGGTKSLGTAATSGLLHKPRMIDEDDF